MKSKGHSLWLVPTGETLNKFSAIIRGLAKEHNAPVFQPHITLLGDLLYPQEECIKRTEQVVSGQKPFIITLKEIDYQDFYFRTLFVKAEKTEPLQVLHNRAKELFNKQDIPEYMPHLSILYGIFPQSVKEKIIKEIGKDQLAQFELKSVHLVKGGEVEDWYIVGEFPLR